MARKSKNQWSRINDNKVRHIWKCEDGCDEVWVSPDWYSNNGTPVCGECDCDMVYVRTEIRKK